MSCLVPEQHDMNIDDEDEEGMEAMFEMAEDEDEEGDEMLDMGG